MAHTCLVAPTRKLQEEKETSNRQQPVLESSSTTTLDAQLGGCPMFDSHKKECEDVCPAGHIACHALVSMLTFDFYCYPN